MAARRACLPSLLCARLVLASPCASVVTSESQAWLHGDATHFSIRINVKPWIQGMILNVQWPRESVNVEHVYQATLLNIDTPVFLDASSATTVEVELNAPGTSFLVSGTGTSNLSPSISCKLPGKDEEHSNDNLLEDDCDLNPKYSVSSSWDAAQTVEIIFEKWEGNREIKLEYVDDMEFSLVRPIGVSQVASQRNTVIMKLKGNCHDDIYNDKGEIIAAAHHEINCIDERVQNRRVSFELRPPASARPRLICNPQHPPPHPPPPPPSPMPAPPPPPLPSPPPVAVRKVDASECELGGVAAIVPSSEVSPEQKPSQVIVKLEEWREGVIVELGVTGTLLDVTSVMMATMLPPERDGLGVRFRFRLGIAPKEAPAFGFTLTGSDISLSTLTCKPNPSSDLSLTTPPSLDPNNPHSQSLSHLLQQATANDRRTENDLPADDDNSQSQMSLHDNKSNNDEAEEGAAVSPADPIMVVETQEHASDSDTLYWSLLMGLALVCLLLLLLLAMKTSTKTEVIVMGMDYDDTETGDGECDVRQSAGKLSETASVPALSASQKGSIQHASSDNSKSLRSQKKKYNSVASHDF